jgi:hypothetical protein
MADRARRQSRPSWPRSRRRRPSSRTPSPFRHGQNHNTPRNPLSQEKSSRTRASSKRTFSTGPVDFRECDNSVVSSVFPRINRRSHRFTGGRKFVATVGSTFADSVTSKSNQGMSMVDRVTAHGLSTALAAPEWRDAAEAALRSVWTSNTRACSSATTAHQPR